MHCISIIVFPLDFFWFKITADVFSTTVFIPCTYRKAKIFKPFQTALLEELNNLDWASCNCTSDKAFPLKVAARRWKQNPDFGQSQWGPEGWRQVADPWATSGRPSQDNSASGPLGWEWNDWCSCHLVW